MDTQEFPYKAISKELLDALQATFPLRAPRHGESLDSLMWLGGARSVVDFLEAQYARSFETEETDVSEN